MKTVDELFTRADYASLPEGFPAQLVEGFLVKDPSPTYGHQTLMSCILRALFLHADPRRVLPAPVDVPIDERNVFQPDVAVFREKPPANASGVLIPLVAIEIL